MLRRALPSLFCAFALLAPAYGQDVFVPRELKAVAVHPQKAKATEADAKAPAKEAVASADASKPKAPKTETAPAKTEKAVAKEKTAPAKDQKAPLVAEQPTSKKATEPTKEKEKAPEKKAAKTDDVATIKVEKAVAAKEPAKNSKEKVAAVKEKADSELPTIKIEKATTAAKEPSSSKTVAKSDPLKAEAKPEKSVAKKEEPARKTVAKTDAVKVETVTAKTEKAPAKDNDKPATVAASKSLKEKSPVKDEPAKSDVTVAKTDKPATPKDKDKPATVAASKSLREKSPTKDEPAKSDVTVAKTDKPATLKEKEKPVAPAPKITTKSEPLVAKVEPAPPREGPAKTVPSKLEQVSIPTQKDPPQILPAVSGTLDTGFTKVADGFDFPVGKPEAEGYYKARGFRPGGHVGEDWDGVRGGDTDLKDPIFSIGDGIVVFARDVHLGWGNVIIVRHAYRENGNVRYIDALYGHLNAMLVSRGQRVSRGQQIATMGTAHGQYDAHLHFEIRKNLEIGMSRSKFQKDFNNYYDPTQFINAHRRLAGGGANYKVAMNTFTHDWMYHFDKNRDFGSRKRSTSQSSAALRAALTSTR